MTTLLNGTPLVLLLRRHLAYIRNKHAYNNAHDDASSWTVSRLWAYRARGQLASSGDVTAWCSPAFLTRVGSIESPQALVDLPLLHDEERGTWAQWLQSAGVRHPGALQGLLFEDGQLALTAALNGLGCTLLREPLVAPLRDRGELVKLFDYALNDGRAYYLCRRADGELSREGLNLYSWLKRVLLVGG